MSKAQGSPLQRTWKDSEKDEPKLSHEQKTKIIFSSESLHGNYLDFVSIRLDHSLSKMGNFKPRPVYLVACY